MDRFLQLVKELDIEDRLTHFKRAVYCMSPWGKKQSVELFNEVLVMISKAVDARITNNNTDPDFFNFLIQELTSSSHYGWYWEAYVILVSRFPSTTFLVELDLGQ